ncbi:MAG: hypothetical protein M1816_005532 [Peltula sp. TS41687]|nr:MAG: hypothetical protein M1816_005532 [Peltula sp. TS41687]
MADDDLKELEALEREASEFNKILSLGILKAFRLDAYVPTILPTFGSTVSLTPMHSYAVLDLQPGVPESDIKLQYRKKSLLIHPDKTTNPSAPEAFDRLKKAQTALSDDAEREKLDEAIADARHLLIREHKYTLDSAELKTEEFKREWREKTKMVLVENEVRRRKQLKGQLAEEGRQQRKEEEELQSRKRRREHEVEWEQSREGRINSWRDFRGKGGTSTGGTGTTEGKGKKKKLKVLG